MLQTGSLSSHAPDAWHSRVAVPSISYPAEQTNVAVDPYVTPDWVTIFPLSGLTNARQAVTRTYFFPLVICEISIYIFTQITETTVFHEMEPSEIQLVISILRVKISIFHKSKQIFFLVDQ